MTQPDDDTADAPAESGMTEGQRFCAALQGLPGPEVTVALDTWLDDASPDDVFELIEAAGAASSEANRIVLKTLAGSHRILEHLRMTADLYYPAQLKPSARTIRARKALVEARKELPQVLAVKELLTCRDRSSVELMRTIKPRSRHAREVLRLAAVVLESGADAVIEEFRRKPEAGSPHVFVLVPFLPDAVVQRFIVTDLLLSGDDKMINQAIMVLDGGAVPADVLGSEGVGVLLPVVSGERRLRVGWVGRLGMGLTRECAVGELGDVLVRDDAGGLETRLREIASQLDREDEDDAGVRRKIQRTIADARRAREAAQAVPQTETE